MKIDPAKLKKAMEEESIKPKELAYYAGWMGPRRVSQILKGQGTNINPRVGEAIARKLKVKVSAIVKDEV